MERKRRREEVRSILLTGGGTGGHLAIVRSVKEELRRRDIHPCYVGSKSGQDSSWFAQDDDFAGKLFLPTRGVVNQRGFRKVASMARMVDATRLARRFMREHKIEAVLSVGGFSAAPAAFAALLERVPLFIHEQNAKEGRLNRVLKPFCDTFFPSFGEGRVDYPVGASFFETARVRRKLGTVIFLGGSQGARAINDFALKLAPVLARKGIAIIHQTGTSEYERIKEAYGKLGVGADLFPFDPDLVRKLARADFAVSRAGASTLWELAANRIPTLFVPYPYAAGDHQYFNAKYLSDRGAAWVVRQQELTPEIFWRIASGKIAPVSERLATLIDRGGAARIVETMLERIDG